MAARDAHARPPESIRALYKELRKASSGMPGSNGDMIDLASSVPQGVTPLLWSDEHLRDSIDLMTKFAADVPEPEISTDVSQIVAQRGYEVTTLPGLIVFPSIIPATVQIALLNRLLHRDLSNPVHKTNLHLHYDIPYYGEHQGSFFSRDQPEVLMPKNPGMHQPLRIEKVLNSKLRWVTLGGQYDWTAKEYPEGAPPEFPPDIAEVLRGLFPAVDAQAAIVNLYSPGDTLSVHRDVSEECDRGLISLSIGCDAIFIIGSEDGSRIAKIRLRSGDAVLMSGESRFAWHAIPAVIAGTCPQWLRAWPDAPAGGQYQQWRGWMENKRINLNVRQMREKA